LPLQQLSVTSNIAPDHTNAAWDSSAYHRATEATVRNRVWLAEHRGKHILVSDFSDTDPETAKAICACVYHIVQQQAPASVRSMVVLDRLYFNHELMAIAKEVVKRDKPFIKKTAVIGLSGMLYIAFQAVVSFSQREMQFFSTREQALDWLAQD
jgi:hypothetical protein